MIKNKGFSLVELLVVISITATLTGLVVPKFGQFRFNQELSDETTKLQSALRSAQLNAINGIKCDSNDLPATSWSLTFNNARTSYTVAPECQGGAQSLPSKIYRIENDSVEIDPIGSDSNCSEIITKISFENISAKVSFNLSTGCERKASKVMIGLISQRAGSVRLVEINKGGSVEILNPTPTP